ncbi:MAG TPA: response regulator transcription factor [Candidatus Sumerlaeota bacterium]|nr:response regulator transcription factor [Candidatus Sumerlaeota bacterium]HNM46708.1 response regulator transcription factor [Candidatus Sumerlaeota bacterium]
MRILIVEDEPRLARSIKKGIESIPSFVVDICHDGIDGQHQALTNSYDLVILDIMLPGADGLSILQAIRAAGRDVPVLILTARNTREDIVRGLDFGSDDYLGKPFDMGELLARIKALIRRSHNKPDPIIRIADLEIDTHRHVVRRGDCEFHLPALEYRLLEYLAFRADQVVSKSDILEHLYDYNWEKFSNVIEVYISALRRKLEVGNSNKLIHTVRGQGYILSAKQTGNNFREA